jgi:hypothetical protein
MRKIRNITAEEENFRVEPSSIPNIGVIRRDSIQPEPIGTIVLLPFRVVGYDKDCDGHLMARLHGLYLGYDNLLTTTGMQLDRVGLYSESGLVVDDDELKELLKED